MRTAYARGLSAFAVGFGGAIGIGAGSSAISGVIYYLRETMGKMGKGLEQLRGRRWLGSRS